MPSARVAVVLTGEPDEPGSSTAIVRGDWMTNPAGGPNTQAGKEVARWNATRHGIRSPAPVVPGLEKVEDWEEHRDGVLESLSPEGHLELVLAERVAVLSWRLHRVTRYEQETIALSQEDRGGPPEGETELFPLRLGISAPPRCAHAPRSCQ